MRESNVRERKVHLNRANVNHVKFSAFLFLPEQHQFVYPKSINLTVITFNAPKLSYV